MAKGTHSLRYPSVMSWYVAGRWTRARVQKAAECGWITESEMQEILGGN
ncbi:MAG: XkdX family protein [Eggerthellaceae bacterium]|nr:XkdX family protein [Eggerthellaceae bacterium]